MGYGRCPHAMARTCVLTLGVATCLVDSVVVANEPLLQLHDRRNKTALHAVRTNVAVMHGKQALDSRGSASQQQQAEQRVEYAVEAAVEMRFEAVTQRLAGCAVKDFRSLADELYATADLLRKTAFDVEKRSVKLLALRTTKKPLDKDFVSVGDLSAFGSGGVSKNVQATLKYNPDGSENYEDVAIHQKSPPTIEFHEAPHPEKSKASIPLATPTAPHVPDVVHSLSTSASDKVLAAKDSSFDSHTFRGSGSAKAPTEAVPVRTNEGLVHDAHGNSGSPTQDASKPSAVPSSYDDFVSEAASDDREALTVGTPVAPFGAESVGHELQARAGQAQDNLVDAMEAAEVAEIKRSIFRALTRLRAATIKEFDTIARLETQAIDAYNDAHNYREENPLRHLHEDEAAPSTDKLSSFHS